jgi:SAM-dependent methyltransferase
MEIDPTNADQADDWDGAGGEQWATFSDSYERLLGVFTTTLVEASKAGADDRCLDIGCGTGATTRALAVRASRGSAVGVDVSGPMLAVARRAADDAGLDNIEFVHADAQVHPFDAAAYDLAVSRMGCMFFGDPVAAFGNIGRALKPDGRLALTVWQEEAKNGWLTEIERAINDRAAEEEAVDPVGYVPGPFSLADPARAASFLTSAGFTDVSVAPLDIPLAFGTVDQAQAFLETWIDDDLQADGRARAIASLRRLLEENDTSDGVRLPSATWLITARGG